MGAVPWQEASCVLSRTLRTWQKYTKKKVLAIFRKEKSLPFANKSLEI